jgi:hypothetical protein
MIVILWILAVLSFIFFITKYLLPFIIEKIIWFKMKILFIKMSKKYDGETRKELEKLVDKVKKISKETEL